MSDRDTILHSIRESLRASSQATAVASTRSDAAGDPIPRTYRESSPRTLADRLALFEHRLRDYEAGITRAPASAIAAAIAQCLAARFISRLAVPRGLPDSWLPPGIHFEPADDLDPAALEAFPGVLTACTLAIAETGTIVLQSGPGQGPRRLSLVPDYHLCVVLDTQFVDTVPEAFAQLSATATLPTTFISGPSATSDIEMTRVRGVHGPRTLEVILVQHPVS
ncbi:MAG TPA: LUD domain-containing protein [Acidobacteriaceae bacterium]|nr:LUD domain-containing protein [Acidobacteriaceae bacterium]